MRNATVFVLVLHAMAAPAAPVQPTAAARAAFERGEKAFDAQKYDEAAAAYQEALRASPNYAPAINGLGSVLFKQKKSAEAIAQFTQATKADAGFKLAWFNLGYAARKTQDFPLAVEAYEKYTALDASDPDGFYGLAEALKGQGDVERAIAAYEGYLRLEKRPSEQKWVEKAKEALEQLRAKRVAAPSPTPTPAPAPAPTAATTAATPVPATAPQPAAAPAAASAGGSAGAAKRIADGDRLWAERNFREASLAYQDAANAEPGSVEAHFKLGNAYAVQGFYSQAIDRWARVQQLSGDPQVKKSAQDNIARAQQKMAQAGVASTPDAGRPTAQPTPGPVTDSARAQARQQYETGVQLVGQRRYAEALNAFNECLKLEPALAVGYVARGSTLIGLRRFAEAAVDYQYALQLDPQLSSPLYGLAEAYRGLNRVEEARAHYQRYADARAPDVRVELQADARQKLEQLHSH